MVKKKSVGFKFVNQKLILLLLGIAVLFGGIKALEFFLRLSLFQFVVYLTPILLILNFIPGKGLQKFNEGKPFLITFIFALLGSFFLISTNRQPAPFANLAQIKSLAASLESKPIEMDNSNLLKPSYDAYYKSLEQGFFSAKINKLMIWKKSDTSIVPVFMSMLKKMLKGMEEFKVPNGDFIVRGSLTPQTRLVIWGDLQGAFPSFVRGCEKLKDLGIIDDELKIKSENDYLIVNGDAVSRSPFQLETCCMIMNLILKNPTNFIYIRGGHENENYWQEFNLKSELIYRVGAERPKLDSEKFPLQHEVEEYFDHLPMAVYFKFFNDKDIQFLRISNSGPEQTGLLLKASENKLYKFLTAPEEKKGALVPYRFTKSKDEPGDQEVKLKAIFKSEKKRETYQDMDGLRLLVPENGTPAWNVLSCPTEVYQKGLKFFYDAFVIVSFDEKNLENSKITLYNQDVRKKDGFKSREANLFTSKELDKDSKSETKTEPSSDKKEDSKPEEKTKESDTKAEQAATNSEQKKEDPKPAEVKVEDKKEVSKPAEAKAEDKKSEKVDDKKATAEEAKEKKAEDKPASKEDAKDAKAA